MAIKCPKCHFDNLLIPVFEISAEHGSIPQRKYQTLRLSRDKKEFSIGSIFVGMY